MRRLSLPTFCRMVIMSVALAATGLYAQQATAQQPAVASVFRQMGPNPFYASLSASLQDNLQDKAIEVRIANVIGKTVYSYKGVASALDADIASGSAQWPKGNYFLLIKIPATGQSEVVKIQKQ